MAKYVWAILTNAADERHAEFNDWYTNVHVPDLLKIDGVTSAERFELAPVQTKSVAGNIVVLPTAETDLKYRYLALYVIETDNIEEVLKAVPARAGTPDMEMTDALDGDIATMCYQLIE